MEFFGIPTSSVDTQKPYREAIKEIRVIILNVDGVLTDGYIQYTESGDEIKTFYARDGFAIREAMKQGWKSVWFQNGSRAPPCDDWLNLA